MAGVPVAIKDDTDVAGQSTMWGTPVDRGPREADAVVVQRLRAAGAIVIGKTNVPELTLWPWTATPTWGVTANPWALDRTPGGSSGGSAAAVASGMAAMALGSDGGGSVRYPAGLTGLVGIKPQRDRLPLGAEHASGWHGLIALGPLTRSARDAAMFLDIAADVSGDAPLRDALGRDLGPLRIAVATKAPPGSQARLTKGQRRVVDQATELLGGLGHTVVEAKVAYGVGSIWNSTVRFLRGAHDDAASLSDQDQLERRTRTIARIGGTLSERALRRALGREQKLATSVTSIFDQADVVLTPLCASPAPRLDANPRTGALRSLRAANTSAWLVPWNLCGNPALSVPIGMADGLPTSVQLVARADDEATILALAAQIEQRREPMPTVPARA